ncbi:MAG TPA: hypothetical protein VFA89_08605 [Terriglobales bacterium]|nr:hypothetical protein [Terriglobales bacterium]
MKVIPGKLTPVFLVVFLFGALYAASGQQPANKSHRKKPAVAPVQPAPPPGPLQPLTLDQLPAVAPQVNYQSGQLVVIAQNSTLGDILRAIHKQTGAAVDVPANATERVVGRFGPAPARDVIASLLNGSHFNYVVLGSATDPNAVSQVILTQRTGGASPPSNTASAQPAMYPPGQVNPALAQAQQDAADANADQPDMSTETPGVEAVEDNTNGDQEQQQADNPQEGSPQGVPQQGQVKTPEQLLQELQQQQQQQQLMQQQQQQQGQPGQPGVYPGGPPVPRPPEPH